MDERTRVDEFCDRVVEAYNKIPAGIKRPIEKLTPTARTNVMWFLGEGRYGLSEEGFQAIEREMDRISALSSLYRGEDSSLYGYYPGVAEMFSKKLRVSSGKAIS